jgi:hypothetical protein
MNLKHVKWTLKRKKENEKVKKKLNECSTFNSFEKTTFYALMHQ